MNQPIRFCAILTGVLVATFLLFSAANHTVQARVPTPPPTSCSTTTIDMKLLVVTNGKTEWDYPAIKQIFNKVGTPYAVWYMSVNTGGITSARWSDGGCHGYNTV